MLLLLLRYIIIIIIAVWKKLLYADSVYVKCVSNGILSQSNLKQKKKFGTAAMLF
jgi:hypothetical protein